MNAGYGIAVFTLARGHGIPSPPRHPLFGGLIMVLPSLHPEATEDPDLIRWKADTAHLPEPIPELSALIDRGVLHRIELDVDEVRTWLGRNGSWAVDGPTVRSALIAALVSAQHATLGDEELHRRIEDILQREVAPVADSHGGGVRVASVRDGVLTVELSGACRGCSESERTVGQLVSRAVQDRYPDIREVKAVKARAVWLPLMKSRRTRLGAR